MKQSLQCFLSFYSLLGVLSYPGGEGNNEEIKTYMFKLN